MGLPSRPAGQGYPQNALPTALLSTCPTSSYSHFLKQLELFSLGVQVYRHPSETPVLSSFQTKAHLLGPHFWSQMHLPRMIDKEDICFSETQTPTLEGVWSGPLVSTEKQV